jgi:hypothetical protein
LGLESYLVRYGLDVPEDMEWPHLGEWGWDPVDADTRPPHCTCILTAPKGTTFLIPYPGEIIYKVTEHLKTLTRLTRQNSFVLDGSKSCLRSVIECPNYDLSLRASGCPYLPNEMVLYIMKVYMGRHGLYDFIRKFRGLNRSFYHTVDGMILRNMPSHNMGEIVALSRSRYYISARMERGRRLDQVMDMDMFYVAVYIMHIIGEGYPPPSWGVWDSPNIDSWYEYQSVILRTLKQAEAQAIDMGMTPTLKIKCRCGRYLHYWTDIQQLESVDLSWPNSRGQKHPVCSMELYYGECTILSLDLDRLKVEWGEMIDNSRLEYAQRRMSFPGVLKSNRSGVRCKRIITSKERRRRRHMPPYHYG